MAIDDLTQLKVCSASEIQVGDILVNLGPVTRVHVVEGWSLLEWARHDGHGVSEAGRVLRSNEELVRWARADEIDDKEYRRARPVDSTVRDILAPDMRGYPRMRGKSS